jgi:hypothetical protein
MKQFLIILILLSATTAQAQKRKKTTTTTTTTTTVVPSTNPDYWPLVWVSNVDMNISYDTTICGMVNFKWNQQPNFSTQRDTKYTNLGYYYLRSTPITYTPQYPCNGGMYSTTNSYYYTLNSGCSFTGNHSFEFTITYYWKDDANEQIVGYASKPIIVTTGRNQWECNK